MGGPVSSGKTMKIDESKLPDPDGQTVAPGAPLGTQLRWDGKADVKPLTSDHYHETEQVTAQRNAIYQPLGDPDTDINAFQAWMESKPLPTGKNLGRLPLLTIGLGGEAGEAIELLKKHLRDDTPIDLPHLILELGDVVLVVSLIAQHFNVPMSEVLKASKKKIQGRIERGTLRGAGDDR